jgi:hypothetical protein
MIPRKFQFWGLPICSLEPKNAEPLSLKKSMTSRIHPRRCSQLVAPAVPSFKSKDPNDDFDDTDLIADFQLT